MRSAAPNAAAIVAEGVDFAAFAASMGEVVTTYIAMHRVCSWRPCAPS